MPPQPGLTTAGLPARNTLMVRAVAAVTAAVCLTVLIVAWRLDPAPSGAGTHMQLGLPTCGWVAAFGKPCPTCGMTTAFAHAADGHPGRAFVVHPMGAVFALATSAAFWAALHVALTGSRVGEIVLRGAKPKILWMIAAAVAVAWAYKWVTWT